MESGFDKQVSAQASIGGATIISNLGIPSAIH